MHDTSMNVFDLGVLIVIGLSAMLSFYRGFIREVLSLGGWIVASIVALRFLEPATNYLKPQIHSEPVAVAVAAIGLFLITLILFTIVTSIILKGLKPAAKVGLLDNLAGLCFGVARGVFIVSIAFFIMTKFFADEKGYPDAVKHSISRPYIAKVAEWIGTLTPDYLDKVMDKDKSSVARDTDSIKRDANQQMDQLRKSMQTDTNKDTAPSIEDLQERIRQENEKH
jgi:membrane protein required for colicin V production